MSVVDRGLAASLRDRDSDAARKTRTLDRIWRLVGGAGAAFATIGWTDVLLLWYPLRIGTPEWEFATVSGTFDALPLATIGTLLLVALTLKSGGRHSRLVLGSVLVVVVLAMSAALILFALSFATGIAAVGVDTRWILYRAGIKTTVSALIYLSLYAVFARSLYAAAGKESLS